MKSTIKDIREDVDNIIDCAFAELIDEYFTVDKKFVEYKNTLVFAPKPIVTTCLSEIDK